MLAPTNETRVFLTTSHQYALGEALQTYPHESREKDGLLTALLIDGPTDSYVAMSSAQVRFICDILILWAEHSLPNQGSQGKNDAARSMLVRLLQTNGDAH